MSIYQFSVYDKNNDLVSLEKYRGKLVLIVNTATKCGLTKQLPLLEAIYKKYREKGFEIIGFPCNQFFKQSPEEINEFIGVCQLKYGVSFTQFNKVFVNGAKTIDLYKYLKKQINNANGTEKILWNFEKFLISKEGKVINRFSPKLELEKVEAEIIKALK
ncbi:MAG: glutathione peroxidase [Mycoplasmoidaceae bacterium]